MDAESGVKTWESCKKLGCELSNGSDSFETTDASDRPTVAKSIIFQWGKGVGGLFIARRPWCPALRIPIGNLGHVIYALLVGAAVFFGETIFAGVLT